MLRPAFTLLGPLAVALALLLELIPRFARSAAAPTAAAGTNHWAFLPIHLPTPPAVSDALKPRSRNPVDHFILARLERAGLAPSPEADRATLIRRLAFDLCGLPPSPAEVDAFEHDPSPDAWERLVDRLLASPHYGEHWGRHWLDIVRYTESQGFEYDRLRDNAWHYRDYVIESFNRDKPYDRFLREQVAGDVLEPVTRDGLVATSVLVCGPYDEAGNAQANATQRMITREEEMEDMLSVVGQGFLGVTLNCARCHAHKFDPIPIDDYYRIKSVFDGVKHGERSIATPEESRAREERIASLKTSIEGVSAQVTAIESEGWKAAFAKQSPGKSAPEPVVRPALEWTFDDLAAVQRAGSLEGGAQLGQQCLRLDREGAFFRSAPLPHDLREKTLEAWVRLEDLSQGGGAAVSIESPDGSVFDAIVFGERQSRKWMAGSDSFKRTRDLDAPEESTAPGGLVHMVVSYSPDNRVSVYRNGLPYGKSYVPGSPLQTFKAGEARILLGKRHTGGGKPFLRGDILHAAVYDRALTPEEVSRLFDLSPRRMPMERVLAALDPGARARRDDLLKQLDSLRKDLAGVKPLPVSYVGLRKQPEPTHRLRRGDVKSPEDVMSPGALSAIRSVNADFGLPADAPEAQRRLKFADWLASPDNPLPARVMMNRVWHFHFGQGLVATPNDFGRSGSAPTHPELLDWLSASFIRSGWSLKAMHRLIVTSATYRQASRFDEAAARLDADNLLLWRYAPHRLEAESVRDALLAVSGELNPQGGGPSFRPFEVQTFPANAYVPRDRVGPEYNRRSVYRMNVNSGKDPLMDAFDCPDPAVKTPRRGVTVTPLQALALMNNSFVQRQADRLSERALADSSGDLGRAVTIVYRRALGRAPRPDEAAEAGRHSRERGLSHFCWALLNSTEFLYVQ
jgi:hypothetical protein